ncbi:MAG: hypothetical protein RLZZ367_375 [Bacteroidota bacterium]|jgi:hypothetical protein
MRILNFVVGIGVFFTICCQFGCRRDKTNAGLIHKPSADTTAVYFNFFLSEKTMITNREQDNEKEGTYLKVTGLINDSTVAVNLPDGFYLNNSNLSNWMLGWPSGKAYYDAGNENLRTIISIDTIKKQVVLGSLLRGSGFPQLNQRVVFWNHSPSGFANNPGGKLVQPGWWPTFYGNSMEFGAIVFEPLSRQWVMYLQEVDTNRVNIYAATSADLVSWQPYNKGKVFFSPENFTHTTWAGVADDGITPQTARLYSAIYRNDSLYIFLSGYDKQGRKHVGVVTTTDALNGPFNIHTQPVVSPGSSYDAKGCFYPKVAACGNKYLMYYDGIDADGTETLCRAESDDLIHWSKYNNNPVIAKHYGWRSGLYTSEPNYVLCSGDTVWVSIGGYKKYNTEFNHTDSAANRLPLDKTIFNNNESEKGRHISGNVMDAQLGVFISTDGGYTFRPHSNNPVWINDYSDTLQNDHIGGDFFYYGNRIIYQAKSETEKRYNILSRQK